MTFYTYLYLREDGTPYYVGKGCGARVFSSNHGVAVPKDLSRILVQEFPSEEDALSAESFLIGYYGRKDNGTGALRNRTDGGGGLSGYLFSEKECQRRRVAASKPMSLQTRERISNRTKGRVPWNKGISKIKRVRRESDGYKQIMSAVKKQWWADRKVANGRT